MQVFTIFISKSIILRAPIRLLIEIFFEAVLILICAEFSTILFGIKTWLLFIKHFFFAIAPIKVLIVKACSQLKGRAAPSSSSSSASQFLSIQLFLVPLENIFAALNKFNGKETFVLYERKIMWNGKFLFWLMCVSVFIVFSRNVR